MAVKINAFNKTKTFEELFKSLFPVLCRVADYYLNDENLSKDIVQEAFLKLWNRQEQLDDIVLIKSYLYKIVRNLSLDYLQKHGSENVELDVLQPHNTVYEPGEELLMEETLYLLYKAIYKLPPQSSKIILLSLEGLGNNDIAEYLGISVNTVKTLKYNSLKTLKTELKDLFSLLLLFFSLKC